MTFTLQMLVDRVLANGGTMDTHLIFEDFDGLYNDLLGVNDVHMVEAVDQWLDTMLVAKLEVGNEKYQIKPKKPEATP